MLGWVGWPSFALPSPHLCSPTPCSVPLPLFLLLYTHPTTPAAATPTSHMCALPLPLLLLLQLQLSGLVSCCRRCHLMYTHPAAPAADAAAAAAVADLQLLLSLPPPPLSLRTLLFVHTLVHPFGVVHTRGCLGLFALVHVLVHPFRVIYTQGCSGCSCSLAPQFNTCNTLVFVYLLCTYLLFIILKTPLVPETCKRLA